MTTENRKYDRLLNVLRNSKPVFNDAEAISERVIRHIQAEKSDVKFTELIKDFFFGWVYIGWMRRSLVAAAILLIVFFGYQQAAILKRINELSQQKIPDEIFTETNFSDELNKRNMLYSITGKKYPDTKITVSEKDIDNMIKSFNKLQLKYHDLLYLIEKDPQLKKYVEERMNEYNKTKN